MNWKRSTLVIASVAVLGAGVKLVMACADPGDPSDMYISFFQNNITAQPQYQPFYYTDYSTLYDAGYFYESMPEDDDMPDANVEEWYDYADKTAKRADIDSFMEKYPYKESKAFFDKKAGAPAEMKTNSFCKFLAESKNSEARDYLLYAKKCEPFTLAIESYWDDKANAYKMHTRDTAKLGALAEEGITKHNKSKNDFLKARYAYQVLRLVFYNGEYKQTLKLYDKLIGSKPGKNTLVASWCLGIKAGALYRTGKKKEAAYLYSKVFDMGDDMKRDALLSFVWATDKIKVADVLTLCKNNREKATMLVMDGLYEKGKEEYEGLALLQKAYTLDPGVKGLSVIMTREINKAEQRYLQQRESRKLWQSTGFDAYVPDSSYIKEQETAWKNTKKAYTTYLDKLNAFAQKIAADKKTTDKAFWYLASSYISFMRDKSADCKKYLDLAGKEKMNPHEHDMHEVVKMICIINKAGKVTPETEAELLPSLKWVESRMTKGTRFGKVYRDFLFHILTGKYMEQKDTVRAICCQARVFKDKEGGYFVDADFNDIPGNLLEHMSIDGMHELAAYVEKSNKTDFERWLTDNTPYPADIIRELEGTKYIRELKFDKAVTVLGKVSKETLSDITLPDVFAIHLQDSQDWNKQDSATTYDKLEFAKKMAGLQKTLETQPSNGRVAFQYANGLYSMSYYGRAHHAVDYYRSTADERAYFVDARKNLTSSQRDYYGVGKAMKYYMIAYNNVSDPEMKARCLFLAAKCWQKSDFIDSWHDGGKAYYKNSLTNPHFETLHNQYRNTKFYKEAYNTCSYLKDYAKKH